MRDEHFGFFALEHRHRVLGGTPFELQDDKKVDLARLLVSLYGKSYAPHGDSKGRKGRIMSLTELNNVSDVDALTGEQEAEAFVSGDYLKMHRLNRPRFSRHSPDSGNSAFRTLPAIAGC
jgi:hypothetical protein